MELGCSLLVAHSDQARVRSWPPYRCWTLTYSELDFELAMQVVQERRKVMETGLLVA